MRAFRNLSFVIFASTCWAVTQGVFLSADGQCEPLLVVGCGYTADPEDPESVEQAGQAARADCEDEDCLWTCFHVNCQLQANGPQCANACGSGNMPKAEGSCTEYSYAFTQGGYAYYCSNGACTGCGDPVVEGG